MALTLPVTQLTTRPPVPARESASAPAPLALVAVAPPAAFGRLNVRVLNRAPELEACTRLVEAHAALAEAGRWTELLGVIRDADRRRTPAPAGLRLATLASRGARIAFTRTLEAGEIDLAREAASLLAEMAAARPDDYVAAQIAAQARIDLAVALRAEVEAGHTELWKEVVSQIAAAEQLLDGFDPILEDSPLLAATRYALVQGIEDGEDLFRDWYEDWSDLDPSSAEPHAAHAEHLLPNWYGSIAEFEAGARAAADRTAAETGAAAYAVMHLAAAEATGDLPNPADLDLFLQGLTDYRRTTGCQYRANIAAGVITELAHAEGLTPAGLVTPRGAALIRALSTHVRGALREFHLPAWDDGTACILWSLGQVFAGELARGAQIHVGSEGLEARLSTGAVLS